MAVPSLPSESSGSYGVPTARRPGGLTAVCVIALVLGGLGLLGSLMGLASLAGGSRLQQAMTMSPQGPGANELAKFQRTMQQRMQAVTDRYRWPSTGFLLVNAGLAACMLAGGIMALNRTPGARTFLMIVLAVAVPFEISRSILNGFMQRDMAAVMSDLLPRVMGASAPANGPNAQATAAVGTMIAKASIILGIAFQLIFSAAKLFYYAIGWFYLRRWAVRHWLEPAGAESSTADGGGA